MVLLLALTACKAPACSREADATAIGVNLPRVQHVSSEDAEGTSGAPVVRIGPGRRALDGGSIDEAPGVVEERTRRLDRLRRGLDARHDAWTASHPGAPFPGTVVLEIDREASTVDVKSVVRTVASAGYPRARLMVLPAAATAPGGGEPQPTYFGFDIRLPGMLPDAQREPPKRFHIVMGRGEGKFVLVWEQGGTVIAVVDVPRSDPAPGTGAAPQAGPFEYPQLSERCGREWAEQGEHRDPRDPLRDTAVLNVDNGVEYQLVGAALDAARAPTRAMVRDGRPVTVPAFEVGLAPGFLISGLDPEP